MKEIKLKDEVQKERFDNLYNNYSKFISNDLNLLIKNVIVIFKRHSDNEEYMVLALMYWLMYFSLIDEKHELVRKKDIKKIKQIKLSFEYEMKWDYKNFLEELLKMDNDLFLLKIIIKYSILSFEKKFINIVDNPTNYYKSIWYIIPYLTFKESPFLWFFQDIYFKKVYPKKFQKIRKYYIDKINKVEFPWEHMFTIVNNISELMWEAEVIWKTKVRRKTYFSIYNKLIRKKWVSILDNIWMRIIFQKEKELKQFADHFEEKYVFINKKDFITTPKANGYQSLHYRYISPYRDTQVMIELQLRTVEMDKEIHSSDKISHFIYTVKQNKWSKHFKEVHLWYNYILKHIT